MRQQVIDTQQKQHGRKVLGVLPIYYPKEVLTALDILAVELWGPPGPPRGAQAGRLQTYVCALARNAVAFVAGGGAAQVDGFLFPHTCDSIQGLATLLPDFGGVDRPAFRFLPPRGEPRPSVRTYLRAEVQALADALAAFSGKPLDQDRLAWAVDLHDKIDQARTTLLDQRARLPLADRAFYDLLRRGEYLWPEDHLVELEQAVAQLADEPVQRGVPLLVSGIVPEPMALLDALADAGAYVAADDYAAVGRRVVRAGRAASDAGAHDPLDRIVQRLLGLPPCSTRTASLALRLSHLERLATQSGAAGVVLHTVQFCEPELFDVAGIRRHFSERGLPVLVLDTELEAELAGRAVTRLEAFVEIKAARRPAMAGPASVPAATPPARPGANRSSRRQP